LINKSEAAFVTPSEDLLFAIISTVPNRAHGMYYPLGRKVIATGYLSFSSWASTQFPAFIKETWASSLMDAPIYSASTRFLACGGLIFRQIRELLAALTLASTFCEVMSPLITNILSDDIDQNLG
jgi:hypothetical protein